VAQRQQVQESERQERLRVLLVLRHLALNRHDVGEDVAVGDDDALGICRRARCKDDLGCIIRRCLRSG
jgi:hypothetical protein